MISHSSVRWCFFTGYNEARYSQFDPFWWFVWMRCFASCCALQRLDASWTVPLSCPRHPHRRGQSGSICFRRDVGLHCRVGRKVGEGVGGCQSDFLSSCFCGAHQSAHQTLRCHLLCFLFSMIYQHMLRRFPWGDGRRLQSFEMVCTNIFTMLSQSYLFIHCWSLRYVFDRVTNTKLTILIKICPKLFQLQTKFLHRGEHSRQRFLLCW